ncbi:ER localized, heme-binding peroxidase [Nadsonia fulvescens var. elongata DSM 6958]|uniref:ER localized, heme-binding peroxidase n=1 Tax=Nadsonia fulvescens var. elongata DSM 6958 TaxID=857566 RepID=A0A1E3PDM5_9ASCO|nr:ER localized, heme-binding peroxidase [Nadsonia fulvescens var. elongata DSM 6958]
MKNLNQEDAIPLPGDVAALANRINRATRAQHTRINNMISLKIVFALRDPRIYRQGIQSFYHVFRTFEECWLAELAKTAPAEDDRIRAILRKVWTPAITRTDPVTRDLMFYYHDDASKFETPIMPAQISFANHIRKVTAEHPHLLLAYGHVMYLALFAGGRILRSNITRAVGLFPQVEGLTTEEVSVRGTNLFRFEVEDEEALRVLFKRNYELATRNDLTEQEKKEIVEESHEIFKRNIDCVAEIASKNQKALFQKTGYKIYSAAYYLGYTLLVCGTLFFFFYYLRRILTRFFF